MKAQTCTTSIQNIFSHNDFNFQLHKAMKIDPTRINVRLRQPVSSSFGKLNVPPLTP